MKLNTTTFLTGALGGAQVTNAAGSHDLIAKIVSAVVLGLVQLWITRKAHKSTPQGAPLF